MTARFIAVVALAARLCGAWESAGAYAPLDVIVGDRLAQMSGFANLSAMASPLDYATSGPVAEPPSPTALPYKEVDAEANRHVDVAESSTTRACTDCSAAIRAWWP